MIINPEKRTGLNTSDDEEYGMEQLEIENSFQ